MSSRGVQCVWTKGIPTIQTDNEEEEQESVSAYPRSVLVDCFSGNSLILSVFAEICLHYVDLLEAVLEATVTSACHQHLLTTLHRALELLHPPTPAMAGQHSIKRTSMFMDVCLNSIRISTSPLNLVVSTYRIAIREEA